MRSVAGSTAALWLLLFLGGVLAQPQHETSVNEFGLVDWLTSTEGGIFNPKQEIRYDDNSSSKTPRLGIFAKEPIEQGEILAQIPTQVMIGPEEEEGDEEDGEDDASSSLLYCQLVTKLAKEMQKGNHSEYSPYIQYLSWILESGPTIPSAWSENGKAIFHEIFSGGTVGVDLINDRAISSPRLAVQQLDMAWLDDCQGSVELESVAGLVKQKSFLFEQDDWMRMIPMYDLYTHRNGDYYNIQIQLVEDDENEEDIEYIQIVARRDILAGEQLHNSYDLCDDCNEELVDMGYGTQDIFRDYGIVEDYPQRYSFRHGQLEVVDVLGNGESYLYAKDYIDFEVVQVEDEDDQDDQDDDDDQLTLAIEWADHLEFDTEGRNFVRRIFRGELKRLYRFQNILFDLEYNVDDSDTPPVPMLQHEWNAIREYYQAITTAMSLAIQSLENEQDLEGCLQGMSRNEGMCPAPSIDVDGIHYDDLGQEGDYLEYIFPTCPMSQIIQFKEYRDLHVHMTNYQKISFGLHKTNGDICLNLDTTLQICAGYRPHYHEFFVHFPARYIDTIKRVIFIGGGDSMLLHEVLKYDSLEKVVGLELDQQVTRQSFRYFRSQPHYDNDKVEWWYGDASKSLPLLPKDYWGSFDLVLVDLSETIMSISVTDELDIFAALSLLLKPEGIMVKNEPYLETFSQFFDYSIHVFYGSPKVCTQVLVMGSNKVDFLRHPVREHERVERFLLEPLEEDNVRYKYMHEYLNTDARTQGKCPDTEDADKVIVKHGKKAGILEILDAENTSVPLDDGLGDKIKDLIEQQGLSMVSEPTIQDGTYIFVLKEGYIILRSWPDANYCAIDLNLWGSFGKQETVRKALTEVVGSSMVSSFRIVVGGMHGTSTWEEDKETIGIQIAQTRNCQEKIESGQADADPDLISMAFDVAMSKAIDTFVPIDDAVIVVACGHQESEDCASLKALSTHNRVGNVVPIWACPDLTDDIVYTENFDQMYACEIAIQNQLQEAFDAEDDEIDVFILDSSAPFVMAQIFQSLWSFPLNREEWLAPEHVFMAPILDASETEWRQNFMERYRKEKHPTPVARAEVEIRGETTTPLLSLGVFAADDTHFFNHIYDFEKAVEDSVSSHGNVKADTPTIYGGVKYFGEAYNARSFDPDTYDLAPGTEQASGQKSMGRQSVFQFEVSEENQVDDAFALDLLSGFLKTTFAKLEYSPTNSSLYPSVGEGGVVVSTFADGGAVLLVWDGRSHVDINLFSRDESAARADDFLATFVGISGLQKTLRDDQPRGTGRVVLFESDL